MQVDVHTQWCSLPPLLNRPPGPSTPVLLLLLPLLPLLLLLVPLLPPPMLASMDVPTSGSPSMALQ